MINKTKKEIHIIWNIEDVKECASENLGIQLTDDKAWSILQDIYFNHDCEAGIGWSTVENYILKHENNSN